MSQTLPVVFVHGDPLLRVSFTPGADVDCGDVLNIGTRCPVICTSPEGVDSGHLGAFAFAGGVWSAMKDNTSGPVFDEGSPVGWDESLELAVLASDATCDYILGICTKAAGASDDVVQFALIPGLNALPLGDIGALVALTDNSGGATADGTIGAVTLWTALTDNGAGTADGTVEAMPNPTDTPATADALRDDIVAVLLPAIRNNFKEITTTIATDRTAMVALTDAVKELSTKVNAIIAAAQF